VPAWTYTILDNLVARIAVIGSGISGLAAAYYLSRKHEVFLYEREERIGGHTHTVTVESSRGPLAIDTGFIVHNDRTYPNLIKLLAELGVPRVNSDMSFAVSCRETGYEYSSRGLGGFFAQWSNVFRKRPYRLFSEIRRFNREAPQLLQQRPSDVTLADFLDEHRYSQEFRHFYLYPMTSAVWSCTPAAAEQFPAAMLIRFFDNHNFLTMTGQHQWKTIPGGCSRYIKPITAPFQSRIGTGVNIQKVARAADGVELHFADGRPSSRFDHAVFATNGDRVLPLFENPSHAERDVLRHFHTTENNVVLHTDDALLPKRKAARASWNYLLHPDSRNGSGPATITYHINRLQSLGVPENYCVTLNANAQIRPDKVLRKFVYHHPLFTIDAMRAQQRWSEISGVNRLHFAGAYWSYGFHEDGVNSALRVARTLGIQV
jgi:predicted NAD/FAD-binding protein